MPSLTDTHCHLNFEAYDSDRAAVLTEARKAGIVRILIPAVDLESSRAAIALAEGHEEIYAAVGIHPNSAQDWHDGSRRELRDLAAHPKVVAIGEIGLDYYWDKSPRELQHQVLDYQLELAADVCLPVVLHNREATKDILARLSTWVGRLTVQENPLARRPGVLHSFSGTADEALEAIAMNFRIGITGPVTYKNAEQMQVAATAVGLEAILVETDSPYLTPIPLRGKRNEPSFVQIVVRKVAELRSLSFEQVASATTANAAELFCW